MLSGVLALSIAATSLTLSMGSAEAASNTFDVVVYGATPAGIFAAIEAQREGLHAAVVEPSDHIGGMVTGGLSLSDVSSQPQIIGGLAKEFFDRVGTVYHKVDGWNFEPKVGTSVLNQMIAESGISVFSNQALLEVGGVAKTGTQVTSIRTKSGDIYAGKVFVDASYEGDLMADAGVAYTYGREASSQYGEALAGVRSWSSDFRPATGARDVNGNLFPGVLATAPGPVGSADKNVQAYGFRFEATKVEANRIPFPKPANYNAATYGLLAKWIEVEQTRLARALTADDVLKFGALPNGKADVNSKGPFSTDFLNGNVGYPDGTDAVRAEISQRTRDYDQGLMYFLANDPSVPATLRASVALWGLPKDEFTDTGNFPTQLYVRESRRMLGSYVMTQADSQTAITKPDSIGLGAYRLDTHMVQRFVDSKGNARNEGGVTGATSPYQMPYRIILPLPGQTTNLLVVGALSASHVAFASLRMEPQFMMLGQAAGTAAKLAIGGNTTVQAVPTATLATELARRGAILSSSSVASETIVDANDTGQITRSGSWTASTAVQGYYGTDYLANVSNSAADSVVFQPNLPANGTYTISARWTAAPNRSTQAKYVITTAPGKQTTVLINQQANGGAWVSLGTFKLASGHSANVTVSTAGSNGAVVADAVRFVK
jgi:hypothetical protein